MTGYLAERGVWFERICETRTTNSGISNNQRPVIGLWEGAFLRWQDNHVFWRGCNCSIPAKNNDPFARSEFNKELSYIIARLER